MKMIYSDIELKSDSFLNQSIDKNVYCLFEDIINSIIYMIETKMIIKIDKRVFYSKSGHICNTIDILLSKDLILINNEQYCAYNTFLIHCLNSETETYIRALTIYAYYDEDTEKIILTGQYAPMLIANVCYFREK